MSLAEVGLGRAARPGAKIGRLYGRDVITDKGGIMRYCDTLDLVDLAKPRPCPKCGRVPGPDGHDPCLVSLPCVRNACCGHGRDSAYIEFEDGRVALGEFTIGDRLP